MNIKALILSLIAISTTPITIAQTTTHKPRLVVNIVVSQMRHDYLQRFGSKFSEKGIGALLNQGVVCTSANYNYTNTNTYSGLATINTGANPDAHGIISDNWIDFTTNEIIQLEKDKNYKGIGSDDENNGRVSARKLIVNSVGDQLKKYNPLSRVMSIAITPATAVVAGGRMADMAFWFDTYKGNWLSSNYYQQQMPQWVEKYNAQRFVDLNCNKNWGICKFPSQYCSLEKTVINTDSTASKFNFDQLFASKGSPDYQSLVELPFGNDMLFEFVKQAIIYENMGRDDSPDMLTICTEPIGTISRKYGTESIEMEDAIYRLDQNVADLLDFIEVQLGLENVLVIFTADHGASNTVRDSGKSASGYFNTLQFRAIINGFLNAQLGTQEWITHYNNRQIYLNRRLIYEKGLNLADIQNMVAGFAVQFRGVANAITANALQSSSFSKGIMEKIQNSYYPRHSGDVVINLFPGWIEEDNRQLSSGGSGYRYDTHVPLIWYGAGIKKGTITSEVDMKDIATTLSTILGIPVPDTASGKSINLTNF